MRNEGVAERKGRGKGHMRGVKWNSEPKRASKVKWIHENDTGQPPLFSAKLNGVWACGSEGERLTGSQKVVGSSPTRSISFFEQTTRMGNGSSSVRSAPRLLPGCPSPFGVPLPLQPKMVTGGRYWAVAQQSVLRQIEVLPKPDRCVINGCYRKSSSLS
jgi:hypothetical protein